MMLSIIIVSFNTKDLLKQCLESIFLSTTNNLPADLSAEVSTKVGQLSTIEVIVVDNNSTDGSLDMIKRNFPQLKLIANPKNLGFATANNQGIKEAKGKYILLLNSDTKIVNNALKRLADFAESKKDLGVAGPKLLNPDQTAQASVAPFYTLPITLLSLFGGDRFLRRSPNKVAQVDWVSGACFLIKREVIEKIGFLDETFFMYVEEMEYCFRAKKAGFQVYFYPQAEVIHLSEGSGNRQKAILGIYQGLTYFYQKHFAPWRQFMLKLLLKSKAALACQVGVFTGNHHLKETYEKAYQLASHV